MSTIYADRVLETTDTTGTGALTLGGAVAGYQAWPAVADPDRAPYILLEIAPAAGGTAANPSAWESGYCTVAAGVLTREEVTATSNGDTAPINLRTGTHLVMLALTADATGNLGTGGGGGGVSDHGALTGLADDDHSQYFNQTRGDARYSQTSHNHAGVYDPAGTAATAVSAHVAASDPHGDRAAAEAALAAHVAAANPHPVALWIDAAAFIPRTTNGCGLSSTETSTNRVCRDTLDFDAGSAEYAQTWFAWPPGWATAKATVYWSATSGTGDAVFGAQLLCQGDGDALDTAFGTAQTVTDGAASANTHRATAATAGIAPGGTAAANVRTCLQLYRDAANGSDTLAVDASVFGVLLEQAS